MTKWPNPHGSHSWMEPNCILPCPHWQSGPAWCCPHQYHRQLRTWPPPAPTQIIISKVSINIHTRYRTLYILLYQTILKQGITKWSSFDWIWLRYTAISYNYFFYYKLHCTVKRTKTATVPFFIIIASFIEPSFYWKGSGGKFNYRIILIRISSTDMWREESCWPWWRRWRHSPRTVRGPAPPAGTHH